MTFFLARQCISIFKTSAWTLHVINQILNWYQPLSFVTLIEGKSWEWIRMLTLYLIWKWYTGLFLLTGVSGFNNNLYNSHNNICICVLSQSGMSLTKSWEVETRKGITSDHLFTSSVNSDVDSVPIQLLSCISMRRRGKFTDYIRVKSRVIFTWSDPAASSFSRWNYKYK